MDKRKNIKWFDFPSYEKFTKMFQLYVCHHIVGIFQGFIRGWCLARPTVTSDVAVGVQQLY